MKKIIWNILDYILEWPFFWKFENPNYNERIRSEVVKIIYLMISLLRFHHQIFLNFANILFSRFENSQKFRADLFSRFEGPNIFARTKFRENGQKPRKPRKLIRAKIYPLKVLWVLNEIHRSSGSRDIESKQLHE